MSPDRLRPETESALRPAAAPGVDRYIGMFQVNNEIVFALQVALVNGRDKPQLVHVLENPPGLVVHDPTVRLTVAQAWNRGERQALRNVAAGEIQFLPAHEINRLASDARIVRVDSDLCAHHANQHRRITLLQLFGET